MAASRWSLPYDAPRLHAIYLATIADVFLNRPELVRGLGAKQHAIRFTSIEPFNEPSA